MSTKHTTEETDEYNRPNELFSKTMNKGFLKDLSVYESRRQNKSIALSPFISPQQVENEDSFQSWVEIKEHNKLSIDTVKNNISNHNDEAPSVQDIKGESSISTIEKIQNRELMEDSLNTCSFQKGSTAKKKPAPKPESIQNEKNDFIGTISKGINYFTTPKIQPKELNVQKNRAEVYNFFMSPKNEKNVHQVLQVGKKNAGFINKKLIANHSVLNKSIIENSSSFTEFRSPKRMLKTKLDKFKADKVLKTEHDALPNDPTFNLTCTLSPANTL